MQFVILSLLKITTFPYKDLRKTLSVCPSNDCISLDNTKIENFVFLGKKNLKSGEIGFIWGIMENRKSKSSKDWRGWKGRHFIVHKIVRVAYFVMEHRVALANKLCKVFSRCN